MRARKIIHLALDLLGLHADSMGIRKRKAGRGAMASVFDVAAYILAKKKSLTTVKLQKLVYYCQAWSLVWDERPIFKARVEAWANGPVVPHLFWQHQGKFRVSAKDFSQGNPDKLTNDEKETIEAVLKHYGDKSAQWLVDLTHMEDPWSAARGNCSPGKPCNNEITHASMMDYYSGL